MGRRKIFSKALLNLVLLITLLSFWTGLYADNKKSNVEVFREKLEKTTDPVFKCEDKESGKSFSPIGVCSNGNFFGLISIGTLLNSTVDQFNISLAQVSVVTINRGAYLLAQISILSSSGFTVSFLKFSLVDESFFDIALVNSSAYSFGQGSISVVKYDTIGTTLSERLIAGFQYGLLNTVGFKSFKMALHPDKIVWGAEKEGMGFWGVTQIGAMNLTYMFGGFAQIGAIFSYTGSFRGFMQAGVINSAGYGSIGASLAMTQEEELPNETVTDKKTGEVTDLGQAREGFKGGMQVGVWNTATRFAGIGQFGVLNMAQTMKGTQTGVVNVARTVYGAQIGLVNYTGDLYGFQIGLVNIVKNNKVPFMPILMASF